MRLRVNKEVHYCRQTLPPTKNIQCKYNHFLRATCYLCKENIVFPIKSAASPAKNNYFCKGRSQKASAGNTIKLRKL